MRMRSALFVLAVVTPLLPQAYGQSVISARSGLLNYFEGVVFLDGQPLERKAASFPRLREGSTLSTESGRAEVLLTPDTYLRIGADSSVRMITSDMDNTQVELLSGSAILDSAQAPEGAFVKVIYKDEAIHFMKPGNYRMDAEPAQLRVFSGEAQVTSNDPARKNQGPMTLEASQLMPLDGAPVVKRFTEGTDGLLDIWSSERGSLIASNVLNSQSISDPLLDTGTAIPEDLASYIGYMPAVPAGAAGLAPYTYASLYPTYSMYSPYPTPGMMVIPAFRPATSTLYYAPHAGTGSIYGYRPLYTGGVGSTYHPVYVSRPATPVHIGAPVHAGTAVHIGGHR